MRLGATSQHKNKLSPVSSSFWRNYGAELSQNALEYHKRWFWKATFLCPFQAYLGFLLSSESCGFSALSPCSGSWVLLLLFGGAAFLPSVVWIKAHLWLPPCPSEPSHHVGIQRFSAHAWELTARINIWILQQRVFNKPLMQVGKKYFWNQSSCHSIGNPSHRSQLLVF